jgi:hypothetical protein
LILISSWASPLGLALQADEPSSLQDALFKARIAPKGGEALTSRTLS